MSLLKIGDDLQLQKISEKVSQRMATLQTSAVPETMTKLQTSRVSIQARKSQIEATLSAMTATKASAWQSALAGDGDTALEGRDQLRAEYAELEARERFVESAIEEGRLEIDRIGGKVSLEICNEVKPDYLKVVVPKARAAARQMLEAMEVERRFINLLLENDVRIGHLQRITFPMSLSRETLEAFMRETAELG
jgi:hypothetical protein